MISRQLSEKIRNLSFLCTIMVVFRHSLNMLAFEIDSSNYSCVAIVENGISKLTEVAVPYFFLVSGFFFFKYNYYAKGAYIKMLRKKTHTLFLPFVIWNLVGLVPLVLTHRLVCEDAMWKYGIQLLDSEWNGVLWYVRDIMTMMLLVPLYNWILQFDKFWLYAMLFLLLFLNWLPVDCGWISSEGILFFFLGGVLQKNNSILKKSIPQWLLVIGGIAWLVSCFAFPRYWPIHKYNTMLGLLVVWQLYNYMPSRVSSWLLGVSSYSFFIYVLHADIIKAMKVAVAHCFVGQETVALVSYFVLPLITVGFLLVIGKFFNMHFTHIFNFVMGGRG